MNCPDINRLIDLAQRGSLDREVQDHLDGCPSCRSELALIRELPAALRPELEVPEHLVRKTMAGLTTSVPVLSRPRMVPVHGVMAGLLGTITVLIAIAVTGAAGSSGLKEMLLFALAVGLVAGLREGRLSAVDGTAEHLVR